MPIARRPFIVKEVIQENPFAKTLTLSPEDGAPFAFSPGQWVSLCVLDSEGKASKEARPYSIASTPTDGNSIKITFTIVGRFTKMMDRLSPGARFGVLGPFGQFLFKENEISHAVFLAGGIGVTPLMGMARYAASKELPTPITFLYSNKTLEGATFFDELSAMPKKNPHLKVVFTFTQPEHAPKGWNGETGRIGKDMLLRHVPHYKDCTFFICGPLKMCQDLAAMLRTGLDIPASRIRVEGWG